MLGEDISRLGDPSYSDWEFIETNEDVWREFLQTFVQGTRSCSNRKLNIPIIRIKFNIVLITIITQNTKKQFQVLNVQAYKP